jgi:glycosyltransferase involved in cell wall biosynthesis
MRVGIDARFLTHPQPGGFKTYTVNLIRALAEVNSGIEYVVYLDRPPTDLNDVPRGNHVRYRVVRGSFPSLGMPYREQVLLPWRLREDRLDLVHFLCNTLPLRVQQRHVLTLHDTIQLTASVPFVWRASLAANKRWAITAYSRCAIRRAAPTASRIVTVSRFEREQISACLALPLDRIAVTRPAPDPGFTCAVPDQKAQWRRELADRFGFAGRFVLAVGYEPRKNIPLLIRAFGHAACQNSQLTLVVVAAAEDHQRASLEALAQEAGLAKRIVILGRVPFGDLVRFYNATDAFVFPSEREGFGLPVLEAMMCGAPTISLKAAAVPEVVGDGGLLLDTVDPGVWAEAITRVTSNPALQADLVRRGLNRAATFTWRRCAEETEAVYRSAYEDRRVSIPA